MTSTVSIRLNPEESVYTVAFLLQPHFSMLAFTAAADALTTANLVLGYTRFRFLTVGQNTTSVISDLGIHMTADKVLRTDTAPTPFAREEASEYQNLSGERDTLKADAFIVCGGYRCDLEENPVLSNVLRDCIDERLALGGLWNGIVAAAHAGLMSGYACALHPGNHSQIAQLFPDVQIRADTVVIDRNRLSAAGPNSAFDLMLLLIQRQDSADTVQAIRKILRADVGLSGQIHDAIKRDDENQLPVKLRNALTLMRGNLEEPLNRTLLAQRINLSTRAMERLFQTHLKTSPAKHYMELRLLRARELLIQSESSVREISEACGFVSGAHFSRAFHKRFGRAPRAYRRPKSVLLQS